MSTFLDKIEEGFDAFKAELMKLFGDHAQVHSLSSDLKAHVLDAAATHFGGAPTPAEQPTESEKPTENPPE